MAIWFGRLINYMMEWIKISRKRLTLRWVLQYVAICNLPDLQCRLHYPRPNFQGQDTTCVTSPVSGFAFPLRTWLRVDAYPIRNVVTDPSFAILACVSFKNVVHLLPCVFITMIVYSLFLLAWLIVGAIMFWGKLDPAGACRGVKTYMYVFLILGFIGVCCNMFGSRNGGF